MEVVLEQFLLVLYCDCPVGLLHFVESKKRLQQTYKSARLADDCECVGVGRKEDHVI